MSGAKGFMCGLVIALLYCSFLEIARAQSTSPSEVSALENIKSSLIDPYGNLNNWNNGDPCTTNWTGVLCYNKTPTDGFLHVHELRLLKMNLSGNLAPDLGRLSSLKILDFMWNNISGAIPKEIGNITSLELLLLNGNKLFGSLPEELGQLSNLNRIQIDQNQISGQIPKSFANLDKAKHFHMNNNSIAGSIPPELSRLPNLLHFLLDNNNLSGQLPPQFSELPKLQILQLDNNNFTGSSIPTTYGNIKTLFKLSLRNCGLRGAVPDMSGIPQLAYLDLSWNQLTGSIPSNKLSNAITTVDLSNNSLNGPIPSSFSGYPNLQRLSLENNQLNGSVPSSIWSNISLSGNKSLILDFQNNYFTNISDPFAPPANVSIRLNGNPVCTKENQLNIVQFCLPQFTNMTSGGSANRKTICAPCPQDSAYNPLSPIPCFCATPLGVGYRLKSPGFSDFVPYLPDFENYLTTGLNLSLNQLDVNSFIWEEGPRLRMNLKFFPDNASMFNSSEVVRIESMFMQWSIPDSDIFGPFEVLNLTLGLYNIVFPLSASKQGLSTGAIVGIVFAAIAAAVIFSAVITVAVMRRLSTYHAISKRRSVSRIPIKIDGVKCFTFQEMSLATDNFSNSAQIGQGGYGKVYKGILADRTAVAIKRALQGSLQGSKEFCTEIELLSRVHHRNLVSLVGYCDEEDEQMLVYEFMPNGSLHGHISARAKEPLNFAMRLRIALGSARGILYLHTEADPPIFHRDIKASNILLDSRFIAKVADFGLSRLAPVPDMEGAVPDHVSTVVKGTPGYLDPEYFLTHKLTDKSDVYSLGVVFLELLTGMQPISHGKNIVREVNTASQSGTTFSVIDSRMGSYPSDCIQIFLALALRCCQDDTEARPSMSEVVRELENIWQLTPEADTPSESILMEIDKTMESPPSSSSGGANPYLSSDVSGSNLLSGVMPSIAPR